MQTRKGMSNLLQNVQVGDSVQVRKEAINKATPAYVAEPLRVQCRNGTRVVAKRPDGSSITRTTAHFKKVPFRLTEEAHRWSSAEWPAQPVNESPPSTGEDGPSGLEQTDGSMIGTGANESIPTDAALAAGLT